MSTVINDSGSAVDQIVVGLAELIVNDIFACADSVQRIELKNAEEKGLGGFNQAALASFVAKSIDKNLRCEPFLAPKS